MPELTAGRLLAAWEHGARRHPIDRALLLFALAAPETPPEQLADQPLGRRNAALFALRRARFGERLAGFIDCVTCGERMELELDAAALPPLPSADSAPIEVAGQRFMRPTSRHLAALIHATDTEHAARSLLRACAETPQALPEEAGALGRLLEAVEAAMDEADPWADLSLAVACPACGHHDVAALDIAGLLWEELEVVAQGLLDDVDALARVYGWSEREILGLSEPRRAAYLARVRA